nr:immunoglobulin heavy chain junction region [Mus musculus]
CARYPYDYSWFAYW